MKIPYLVRVFKGGRQRLQLGYKLVDLCSNLGPCRETPFCVVQGIKQGCLQKAQQAETGFRCETNLHRFCMITFSSSSNLALKTSDLAPSLAFSLTLTRIHTLPGNDT